MFKEKVNAHTDRRTHDGQLTMTSARWPTANGANKEYPCEIWKLYHNHSKAMANLKVFVDKENSGPTDRPKTICPHLSMWGNKKYQPMSACAG